MEPGLAGPPGPSAQPAVGVDTTSGHGCAVIHPPPAEVTSV